MTTAPLETGAGFSAALAGEIRAVMGRRSMSQRQLALRMTRDNVWLSRRIGRAAPVQMTLDEAAEIADALNVDIEGIVVAALRACRDSNPKPSDMESVRPRLRLIAGAAA